MENIIIRQFTPDDYDRAVEIWHQSGLAVRPGDDKASLMQTLERNPGLFLVAAAGDDIIGTAIGTFDGRRGYIYHLAVLPALQGKGVGRRLVAEIEKRLAALGCPKLNLSVHPDNLSAIKFYEALGFARQHLQMGKDL